MIGIDHAVEDERERAGRLDPAEVVRECLLRFADEAVGFVPMKAALDGHDTLGRNMPCLNREHRVSS